MNEEILRFIRYLSWKMDCLQEQESAPLKIDRAKATLHMNQLEAIVQEKKEELRKAMPKVPIMAYYNKPKNLYKKDGSLSAHGVKWFDTLRRLGLPDTSVGPVGEIIEYEDGNPNSDIQIKEFLFSLGWEPDCYKFVRNKETGEEKKIPQVRYYSQNDERKGELTDSVRQLIKKNPSLESLDGLTVAKHRLAIFKSFLDYSDEQGNVVASAGGFTNTLRMKHRLPIVNLPKAISSVPWGAEIRSCIVAQEGKILCGSDVSSLEDMTKRHLIYDLDSEFVEAMNEPGYDPHISIAIEAGKMTEEEYKFFKWYKDKNK